MVGTAVLLVLSSGLLHAIWNLYTKKSGNKNLFLWFVNLIGIIVFIPWAVLEWDVSRLTLTGITVLLGSIALHGLYSILLAKTYSIGDLSQVYPIMRGTSPLLVPLLGVTLLGERLSAMGWLGVALIVLGIVFLSNVSLGVKKSSAESAAPLPQAQAPLLALAVGICIAGYIVVDKVALQYVSPAVLIVITHIGNLLALTLAAFRGDGVRAEVKSSWRSMLLGGIIAPGGYLLFLFALSLAPVAQLAPMREIGTVFGTILGVFILREKQGARRMVTSLLITAGVIVLGLWGS
ncbi:DMT family transporter [Paenibacillus sp. J5C_2022]|uniref:DMT family transporter n=1 Tax=Paenibacillus sp. J5C2022 TaxID=2977129 RepID=UPI0021D34379|nr:DMT family transporter [Paenibacillus sp. J5C2022]MCU6711403.1 DMT family transporter [Paenibacillus sp. J5C2022]